MRFILRATAIVVATTALFAVTATAEVTCSFDAAGTKSCVDDGKQVRLSASTAQQPTLPQTPGNESNGHGNAYGVGKGKGIGKGNGNGRPVSP